jgi:hypothetical protein
LATALLTVGTTALVLGQSAPAPAAPVVGSDYVFRAPTGLLIFHVRPDQIESFEAVMTRLSQGLDGATDDVRRQQRAGWRLFRSEDAPAGTAVYVVMLDPVVAGADYDPVRMMAELLPGESQPLFERLKAAVIKVERMGLARVR